MRPCWSVLQRLQDSRVCLLRRSLVLLPAPLGAPLPAQDPLLLRPQLPGADQPRRPPAASAALPPGGDQGAAAGAAALHHPGPVSSSSTDLSTPSVPLGHGHLGIKPRFKKPNEAEAAQLPGAVLHVDGGFCGGGGGLWPGLLWTGGSSWPTLTTRALCRSPSISCSCWTRAALTWCR